MAEFTTDLQSIPFVDIAPNMELMINQYAADDQFNSSVLDYSSLNFHSYMPVSTDNNYYTNQGTEFQGNLEQNFPSFVDQDIERNWNNEAPSKKRIAVDDVSESSSRISTPSVSETGIKRKNSSGRGKRVKSDEKEDDTEKEVVHVRARRGQATDSHSLAERVRRGKINERLRCLQNIVPGCSNSKPVGMAVMLDEIINYVQSLQNQIEFLSMKLTAASSFSDFNSETYDINAMQRGNIYEVTKMEGLKREEEYASSFHCNQFGLSDFNFGR